MKTKDYQIQPTGPTTKANMDSGQRRTMNCHGHQTEETTSLEKVEISIRKDIINKIRMMDADVYVVTNPNEKQIAKKLVQVN